MDVWVIIEIVAWVACLYFAYKGCKQDMEELRLKKLLDVQKSQPPTTETQPRVEDFSEPAKGVPPPNRR